MINPFSAMTAKVKIILAVVALVGVFGIGFYANGLLWEARYLSLEKTHLEEKLQAEKDINKKYAESMKKIDDLNTLIVSVDRTGYEELKNVQKAVADLSAAYLSGNKRLSVLIQRPRDAASPQDSGPSVDHGEERADLAPRVAAGLTGLAGRGDQGLIALGACQVILDAVTSGDPEALLEALERYKKPPQ